MNLTNYKLKSGQQVQITGTVTVDNNGDNCGARAVKHITVAAYTNGTTGWAELTPADCQECFEAILKDLTTPKLSGDVCCDRITYLNDSVSRNVTAVVGRNIITGVFAEWLCRNAERLGQGILECPLMINKNYEREDPMAASYIRTWIWDPTGKLITTEPAKYYGIKLTQDALIDDLVNRAEKLYTKTPVRGYTFGGTTPKADAAPWFTTFGLDIKKQGFKDLFEKKVRGIKTRKL